MDHAEIGKHVLDFCTVKELGTAIDHIGDTIALEGIFQLVGLGIHAVKNGIIVPLRPLRYPSDDLRGHILGLVIFVHGGVCADQITALTLGPKLLTFATVVITDDCIGCLENVFGGAVILFQADDTRTLILLFKGQNILNGSTAETIDGLVIVTYHTNIFPLPC